MSIRKKLGYLLIIVLPVLSGCGLGHAEKEARQVADRFYQALEKGDAAEAAGYCETDESQTKQMWKNVFSGNMDKLGKVTYYIPSSGFHVSISTDSAGRKAWIVSLAYKVDFEYGKTDDSLHLIKHGDSSFKIYKYDPVTVESRLKDEYNDAGKLALEFMQDVQQHNTDAALGLCGYSAFKKNSPDDWKNFIEQENELLGNVISYEIDPTNSEAFPNNDDPNVGHGNVYRIIINTTRDKGMQMEHLEIFQPTYNDSLRVIGYFIH